MEEQVQALEVHTPLRWGRNRDTDASESLQEEVEMDRGTAAFMFPQFLHSSLKEQKEWSALEVINAVVYISNIII